MIINLIFWASSLVSSSIYDISLTTIENKKVSMKDYAGKVLLIVNTASKCGFTSQYEDLEMIYKKYQSQGFEVLGFPSNDFAAQEPGSADEIKKFCKVRYGVTFPLFKKDSVRGDQIQPLYKYLTTETSDEIKGAVKWNFAKFLVDRKGVVIDRFSPSTSPSRSSVTKPIEKALAREPAKP